jgi:aminoglycoside phosphotransferase (APT) family kinase protein
MAATPTVTPGLGEHLARLFPDHRISKVEPLAPDSGATKNSTTKSSGYGAPVRISLVDADGHIRKVVWRPASPNEFGHDRRADRAAQALLAFDDFATVPHHIGAIDVGAIGARGELISLRDAGELYLLTSYAEGTVYAEDLRRVTREGVATALDHARVDALASYLAALHTPIDAPIRYRRAIRDLVGDGEGIFGILDGYPAEVEGASPARLQVIEARCVDWRWRLRNHEGRLTRTHGDFHPFNIVFGDDAQFTCLDASRGACGDPADDITAMSINYVLFALDNPGAWRGGLGPLWHRFWDRYRSARQDPSLCAIAPPFFAWRALVVCNPRFYPGLSAAARDVLLRLAETALAASHFDPDWADELFDA